MRPKKKYEKYLQEIFEKEIIIVAAECVLKLEKTSKDP